jgi:hypothetical protein
VNVIFWAALALFILGAPALVKSFVATNKRIDADVEFLRAIPADMEWPQDIDPYRVEK